MTKNNRKKTSISKKYCHSLYDRKEGILHKPCNRTAISTINRKQVNTIFIRREELEFLRQEIVKEIQLLRNTFGEY